MPSSDQTDSDDRPFIGSGRDEDVVTLGPNDFQRIGLRPTESRLDVIRRAASRASQSLAKRQLDSPCPLTERQLTQIAVSTYRLLDPRQRRDRRSRAHVGRIRPGALYHAGRAEFANGKILIQSCVPGENSVQTHHTEGFEEKKPEGVAEKETASGQSDAGEAAYAAAAIRAAIQSRLSRAVGNPLTVVTMICLLLATAAALWFWGESLQGLPARYR